VTIALVASIESILTAVAIDQMDPEKQKSDMNQELIAKGIGNVILGLIGGLPIIAEVVRSSANVNNGAKTKWANFFHGLFLFVFVAFLPSLIHKIPVSALAALLVVVGFRLSIPEIRHSIKSGIDHFVVFSVTVYFVISHDLLVGVGLGLVVKFIIHIINVFLPEGVCFNDFFVVQFEKQPNTLENESYNVYGVLVFSNILSFQNKIEKLDKTKSLLLDFSHLRLIDRTFLSFLKEIREEFQRNGGELQIVGLEKLRPMTQVEGSGRKLQSK
jgi:MFS superfamily sulfate permease-like transporter